MSVHYNPSKTNIVADALRRLYMASVAYVDEKRKELVKEVNGLACMGVRLMSISDSGISIKNGENSSLVVEVKEKHKSDPILLNLRV